jgi:hypothetical protein
VSVGVGARWCFSKARGAAAARAEVRLGTEGREAKGIPDKKETGCPPSSRLITTAPPKPSPPFAAGAQTGRHSGTLWQACRCCLGGPAAPGLMEPWSAPRASAHPAPSTPAVAGRSPGKSRSGPLARRPRRRDAAMTGGRSGRLEGARRAASRASWHGVWPPGGARRLRCSTGRWPLVPRPQRASPQGAITQGGDVALHAADDGRELPGLPGALQLSAPFGRAACRAGSERAQACAGCV